MSGENFVKLDLTDLDSTRIFIEKTRPEFLIHAAAQRFPDKMDKDPEASIRLNVDATRTLAEAMSKYRDFSWF
jgi:dTDP-4-dehydrorhamnose reductase